MHMWERFKLRHLGDAHASPEALIRLFQGNDNSECRICTPQYPLSEPSSRNLLLAMLHDVTWRSAYLCEADSKTAHASRHAALFSAAVEIACAARCRLENLSDSGRTDLLQRLLSSPAVRPC